MKKVSFTVSLFFLCSVFFILSSILYATEGVVGDETGDLDLCYSARVLQGEKHFMIPVSHFPPNHALLQDNAQCGYTRRDRIRIKAKDQCYWNGSKTEGYKAFYSYSRPRGASSNTGYEQSNAAIMYFIVDDNSDVYGCIS